MTEKSRSKPRAEQLSGLIERVTFHSDESGFCVLRVKAKGHRDQQTVIGTLPQVRAGEWFEAEGRWTVDSEHGQQFRAEILHTTAPVTTPGIERYLASGLIKGIGPAFAQRLVNRFGERVLDVIESTPKRLMEVKGIGKGRHDRIVSAWAEQRVIREIMVFLHSHGVSTSRAFRIYKTYGNDAIEKVSQDPYRLARDIHGIGFKTADTIAESLGIDRQSLLRGQAGLEYVLQELTGEGHCGSPRDELIQAAVKVLEIPAEIVESALEEILQAQRVVLHARAEGAPLVYLAGLDAAEQKLATSLFELSCGDHPCPEIKVEKAVAWVERKVGLQLAPQQRDAIWLACRSKVLVITGGPGVGKTTVVNSIVQIMQAKRLTVVLAAPTGRAAKRMAEATRTEAKTIHRLLEFDPATMAFRHNESHPLEGDLFIIDEASMLDVVLAQQLIRAVLRHAGLILIGDVDQLPSVGPGCVLRDIIESQVFPVCRLTQVFRQAAQSAIITNAHRINQGEMPLFPRGKVAQPSETDCYFAEAQDPEKALALTIHLASEAIPSRFGFDRSDIQVLTPMQRGVLGCRNLNLSLQAALNPTGPSIERYGWTFRVGDKVIQTVNDYDKDIFNGDIGRIVRLDEIEQELTIRFDNRDISYDFNELDELMLSYAVTVHKSQGSEYPVVIIPVHTQHYTLLQRNLLYTAVTRGRKLVVLVGARKAIAIAVNRVDSRRRVTLLKERLTAARTRAARLAAQR